MKVILLLVACAAATHAASWNKPEAAFASALIGVAQPETSAAFISGGSNGEGAESLKSTDGGKTWNPMTIGKCFLLLDTGATSDKSVVINGLFGAQYSTDGTSFQASRGGGGQGQSVEGMGKNGYGIVGAFGGVAGGVATSTDGGKTFQASAVSVLDANHPVRYGAYPSDKTWYVSAGSWPSNSENFGSDEKSLLIKHLSETIQIRKDRASGEFFYNYIDPKELRKAAPSNNITAYHAAITKTTDGGKTFTKLFEKDNACFYFNGIDCFDEMTCIAAAEGHNCANPGAYFYVTHDGGKTWNATGSDAGGGAMGARMVSKTEGWIAGGGPNKLGLMEGRFFHTVDGGASWEKVIVEGIIPLGLDCANADNCVATAVTNTRQATVVLYN